MSIDAIWFNLSCVRGSMDAKVFYWESRMDRQTIHPESSIKSICNLSSLSIGSFRAPSFKIDRVVSQSIFQNLNETICNPSWMFDPSVMRFVFHTWYILRPVVLLHRIDTSCRHLRASSRPNIFCASSHMPLPVFDRNQLRFTSKIHSYGSICVPIPTWSLLGLRCIKSGLRLG